MKHPVCTTTRSIHEHLSIDTGIIKILAPSKDIFLHSLLLPPLAPRRSLFNSLRVVTVTHPVMSRSLSRLRQSESQPQFLRRSWSPAMPLWQSQSLSTYFGSHRPGRALRQSQSLWQSQSQSQSQPLPLYFDETCGLSLHCCGPGQLGTNSVSHHIVCIYCNH